MSNPTDRVHTDHQGRVPQPPGLLGALTDQALLRIATDSARVGLAVLSPDRRYLYANAMYAEILGLPSDIVGRPVADIFPALYDHAILPQLDRAFAGERVSYETRRPTPIGDRYFVVRYEPTIIEDSTTIVVVVITDITDWRRTREDSNRFTAIVESSEHAIISKDLDGIVTSWNAGAERLSGYSAAEMLGTSISRLVPEDRQDEESHIQQQVRRGERVPPFETMRRTKSGELVNVSIATSPVRDANGSVIGSSTMVRDIGEAKRAAEALRFQEERAQRYLDTADVIMLALDTDGCITLINRKGTDLLGWSESELLGRKWIDTCVPPRIRAELAVKLAGLIRGEFATVENPILARDGSERLIEWHNRVLFDEGGRVVGTLSSGADVTDRRALEAQYHQALKMEAVGQLAAGVAHDFNNLLTVILGYAQLLLSQVEPTAPIRADIAEINSAGLRAAALTRQLLAFSRKQIIEPTLLDLNAVVDGVSTMLERLIGEDIALVLRRDEALGFVNADRGQTEQIVLNLAVNARDAMPQGGTLTIETANVELDENYTNMYFVITPGSYVALTVTDTGTGMTPDVRARLFEPFFTTKESGKGTGLGLASVHGIVTRAAGGIGVRSEVGAGTTFTVYLPRVADGEMERAMPNPLTGRPEGGETVLVVEDADGLRVLVTRILEGLKYRVLVAANSAEAIEVFARNPSVDLVLTDVIMPGGSGPELTKELWAQRPGLKVIYMSGYTEDAISHHGVLDPGIAFLNKPFTAETLARKIREVLHR